MFARLNSCSPLIFHRPSARLLPDRWLLPQPLPGRAADEGGGRRPPGVPRSPPHRRPGAQGADDKAHVRRPLRCQSEWRRWTGSREGRGTGWQLKTCNYSVKCETFQSQQARLATLYLPLFGLLQENVQRLNVKESGHVGNHSVSLPPGGPTEQNLIYLCSCKSKALWHIRFWDAFSLRNTLHFCCPLFIKNI